MDITDIVSPDVLDRILSGNAPTEAENEISEASRDVVRTLSLQYAACFKGAAGKAVLQHLRSITIEQSTFVPGVAFEGSDGLSAEQNGFMREGQNSIVLEIGRYLAYKDDGS